MINEALNEHLKISTSPILNSLGRNNSGVDPEEEELKKEYDIFAENFIQLGDIAQNDKIGRSKDGKYYLFQSGVTQKAWIFCWM